MRRAVALLAACLASAASAQEGEMIFTWRVSDTGNGNGIITPGESATLSLWASMDPQWLGFAGALYDIVGGSGWETGSVIGYDNLLDELTDDGQLESNGDITAIFSLQAPPFFNDHFCYDNPIELYRVVWSPADYDDRTVSVHELHLDCQVFTDQFGTTLVYTCIPGEGTFQILDCRSTDVDGNGVIDIRDIVRFLNLWVDGDPLCDWNDDGTVDTEDLTAFLNDWVVGC